MQNVQAPSCVPIASAPLLQAAPHPQEDMYALMMMLAGAGLLGIEPVCKLRCCIALLLIAPSWAPPC